VLKLDLNTPLRQIVSLIVLALIWGSSFILMKKGLVSLSSAQVAFYRLFAAFITLLPFALLSLRRVNFTWRRIRGLFVVALCGNLLPAWLFAEAQTQIASGVAGMLNSLVPLFTIIIGSAIFKVVFKRIQVFGVFLGMVGASFLVFGSGSGFSGNTGILYPLMVVAATLCYAISVNTIKMVLDGMSAIQITSITFLFIGPVSICGMLLTSLPETLANDQTAWVALGYISLLGILGTALALLLFNQLVQFTTPIFASTVTYLIPIVAVVWGFVDGELLTSLHIAGMVFILTGVYMIRK
jgi:drug/metabolite transporter (DMT)-like permease